jgi:hypothetical protein
MSPEMRSHAGMAKQTRGRGGRVFIPPLSIWGENAALQLRKRSNTSYSSVSTRSPITARAALMWPVWQPSSLHRRFHNCPCPSYRCYRPAHGLSANTHSSWLRRSATSHPRCTHTHLLNKDCIYVNTGVLIPSNPSSVPHDHSILIIHASVRETVGLRVTFANNLKQSWT